MGYVALGLDRTSCMGPINSFWLGDPDFTFHDIVIDTMEEQSNNTLDDSEEDVDDVDDVDVSKLLWNLVCNSPLFSASKGLPRVNCTALPGLRITLPWVSSLKHTGPDRQSVSSRQNLQNFYLILSYPSIFGSTKTPLARTSTSSIEEAWQCH